MKKSEWLAKEEARKEEYEKQKRQGLLSYQIGNFYRETIGGLRRTVSLSRKGKPRKQSWGMHIEH